MIKTKSVIIMLVAITQLILLSMWAASTYAQAGVATLFPPPTPFKGVRTAGPDARWTSVDFDNVQFMANLWNLASGAQGTMTMNFTGPYVEVFGNFTNLPNQVTVQGGPGIRYGQGIWGGLPPAHPLYNIPKKVTALPYVIFFANYTIYEKESTLPLTASLYLWTVKALRSSGTQAGDVLVIVRVYRHPGWPLTGTPQANVTAPLIINNTLVYGDFKVFTGNLDRSSNTHTTVVFELTAPVNIRNGRVGIPIQDYIALAANILESLAPKVWSRGMVLNNTFQMIDFTIEWASNTQGKGVFKWRLYEISFLVGTKAVEKTITTTTTKTITQAQTTTTTSVSTALVTTTTTKEVTTTSTLTVPTTITATILSTKTATTISTVLSTTVSVSPTTVIVTDWTTTTILAVVLLIVGIAIGWIIKRK